MKKDIRKELVEDEVYSSYFGYKVMNGFYNQYWRDMILNLFDN